MWLAWCTVGNIWWSFPWVHGSESMLTDEVPSLPPSDGWPHHTCPSRTSCQQKVHLLPVFALNRQHTSGWGLAVVMGWDRASSKILEVETRMSTGQTAWGCACAKETLPIAGTCVGVCCAASRETSAAKQDSAGPVHKAQTEWIAARYVRCSFEHPVLRVLVCCKQRAKIKEWSYVLKQAIKLLQSLHSYWCEWCVFSLPIYPPNAAYIALERICQLLLSWQICCFLDETLNVYITYVHVLAIFSHNYKQTYNVHM